MTATAPRRHAVTLIGLALLAGAALPTQAAVNTRLRLDIGAPILAALISFAVGTAILGAIVAARRGPLPLRAAIRATPAWAWLGGACGAAYVLSTIIVVPRLGAAATLGFIVAGQQVASLVIDHLGLLRLARRPATLRRVAGAVLLLAGVAVVQLSR